MQSPVVLIDGDVLCYSACRPRWQDLNDYSYRNGEIVYNKRLDADGHVILPVMNSEESQAYLEEAWGTFQKRVQEVCDLAWAEDFMMAVKGEGNYRDLVYVGYKANRAVPDKLRNTFVPILRERACRAGLAIAAHGREADDLLRIWALECSKIGRPYIVASSDKDLRMIPGKHLILGRDKKEHRLVNISEEEARRLYYMQLLTGDSTDNIPGIYKVGPVKAEKFLAGCVTDEEYQEAVLAVYMEHHGDDFNYFLANAKMIHLQRWSTDYFDIDDWPLLKELLC